jgi:hypothetical protein
MAPSRAGHRARGVLARNSTLHARYSRAATRTRDRSGDHRSRLRNHRSVSQLTLRNTDADPLEVPASGLPLLLNVELVLESAGRRMTRGVGVGDPVPAATQTLAPGAATTKRIDPLGDGPREVALAAGTYRAMICVRGGPAGFNQHHGGQCSNAIDLPVAAAKS